MTDFYLFVDENELARDIFTGPDWQSRWTSIAEKVETVIGSAALVRLDPAAALPIVQGDAAILIEDLGQLQRLVVDPRGWSIIVFQPSYLACLDALRLGKRSIVARRALTAGETLVSDDLATVVGGGGLDETIAARLVGTRLAYDVAAGGPITFGFVESDDIELTTR